MQNIFQLKVAVKRFLKTLANFIQSGFVSLGLKKLTTGVRLLTFQRMHFLQPIMMAMLAKLALLSALTIAKRSCQNCLKMPFRKGESFGCNYGYYKEKNSCIKLPLNAFAISTSDGFTCKNEYQKTSGGDKCVPKQIK